MLLASRYDVEPADLKRATKPIEMQKQPQILRLRCAPLRMTVHIRLGIYDGASRDCCIHRQYPPFRQPL